jgi:hypothetical protein
MRAEEQTTSRLLLYIESEKNTGTVRVKTWQMPDVTRESWSQWCVVVTVY